MTPTWATILVAVIAGVGGGLLATMLRISHERGAELRARMVAAADEFAQSVIAARQRMRTITRLILTEHEEREIVDPATERYAPWFLAMTDPAGDEVDDVLAKQTRIHLLFGDLSPTGIAATAIEHHLRLMYGAIMEQPDSIHPNDEYARYLSHVAAVRVQLEAFNRAALDALSATTPRRTWRWIVSATGRAWG